MVSSFPRTVLVWHLLHAGCPCAFPMGEHVQDSGSCSLFYVSDLQLFPGTKRFMVMSSINMLMLLPREMHQTECIALTVLGWTCKAAVDPLPFFFHSFSIFLLQLSATCDLKHKEMESGFYNAHLSKKFLYRLSPCLYTNKGISTVHPILSHRKQIMLA